MKIRGRNVPRTDVALLVAVIGIAVSVALAAMAGRAGSPDDRARAIEAQLRCPTCQGLSIADSPAGSARQMRVLVREQLAAGASDDDVRAFFVARYGRWILLDPPASGPDLALWLAPAVIVAFGALLVVRRARARPGASTTGTWSQQAPPAPRLGTIAIAGAMVLALAVPIAAAVGPRSGGREVSGGSTPQSAASIEELEAFVRAEPRDVEALVTLGDALLAAGRAADATRRYRAALELDPNDIGALLGLGSIFLGAGRPDAAGPVFDRVLALSPDQYDALLYRAVARLQVEGSATEEVRRDVERFLAVAPPDDPRRQLAAELLEPSPPPSAPATTPAQPGPVSP